MYLGDHAQREPGKAALIHTATGTTITYGELDARSNRLAHLFRSHGLQRGGHVALLMENNPRKLNGFLDEAHPDGERLRALAQTLAGAALSGGSEEEKAKFVSTTPQEQAALAKLLANWRSLIDNRLTAGEGTLFERQGR